VATRVITRGFLFKEAVLSLVFTALVGLLGHFGDPNGLVDTSNWNWITIPISHLYYQASSLVGGEIVLLVITFATCLALGIGIELAVQRVKMASDEDKIRWLSGWRLALTSLVPTLMVFGIVYLLPRLPDEGRARLFGQPFVDWRNSHLTLSIIIWWALVWTIFALFGRLMRVSIWPETKRSTKQVETVESDLL
jgi:hypothetical protein